MIEEYFGPAPERAEHSEAEMHADMDKIRTELKKGTCRPFLSVPSLVKKAKHAARNAATQEIRVGFLAHAIKRLEHQRDQVSLLYHSNVLTSTNIDDLGYLSDYITQANQAIVSLALLIERIQLEAAAREAAKASANSPEGIKGKTLQPRETKAAPIPDPDNFVSKKDAALFLGISLRHLGNLMKLPGFPVHRASGDPRFRRSELLAWQEAGRTPPPS
jgi:hypothetical protein